MKIELVSWLDIASGESGWQPTEGYDLEPQPIETVGYVVKETKEYLVMCQSRYDNEKPEFIDNLVGIPKGCITMRSRMKMDLPKVVVVEEERGL